MRAIKLNAENNSIDVVEWGTLEDLQKHVGGLIEPVHLDWLEKNDLALLVNEDGLFRDYPYGIGVRNSLDYFIGNGLIVGDDGERYISTDFNETLVEDYLLLFNFERDPNE